MPRAGGAELALSPEKFDVHLRDHAAAVPYEPVLTATATLNVAASRYLALLPMTAAGELHLDVAYLGTSLAGFPKAVTVYPGALAPGASTITARPTRVGTNMELELQARDEFGNLVRLLVSVATCIPRPRVHPRYAMSLHACWGVCMR